MVAEKLATMKWGGDRSSQNIKSPIGDLLPSVSKTDLHRRHLTESQRGMVAAKMANLNNGERPPYIDGGAVTQASAKEMLSVGESTVTRAKKIQRFGSPELNAAVESGELTVGAAHKVGSVSRDFARAKTKTPVEGRVSPPSKYQVTIW